MKNSKLGFLFLILVGFGVFAMGCSSSEKRGETYITKPREPANYNPHPGAYLTDRFQVERAIPKSDTSHLPFYFKQCSRNVGSYMGTNTQYDCDY